MLVGKLDELTPRQVYQLLKLRVDVFVVEQQCPYEEIDDIDATATHILALEEGAVVGCARVYDGHVGRLCVDKRHRGTGLAQAIMTRALELCDGPVEITAQAPLASYYEQFGFAQVGEEFDWDGIPHVPMRLEKFPG